MLDSVQGVCRVQGTERGLEGTLILVSNHSTGRTSDTGEITMGVPGEIVYRKFSMLTRWGGGGMH